MIASLLTKQELAKSLGVSRVALNKWEREGCPVEDVLSWSLPDAVEFLRDWRRQHKLPRFQDEREPDEDGDLQQQLLAAKVRDTNAAARKKEIENQLREGQLYEAEQVEQSVAELTGMIRHRIETIADELETEWPPEVRQAVTERLRDKLHLILTEMSQWQMET